MAIPGILQQLAKANPMMGTIKQMIGMVKSARDPQAMLNQMMMTNPQLKQVMDIVNQYNGDTQKAFYETATKMGVDPNEIIDMMK